MKTEEKKAPIGGFTIIHPQAAGIDIGDTLHYVAIEKNDTHEVREFSCFTDDLDAIVKWLKDIDINTVAMESTGVYWLSLYLKLEEAGIEPYLVNAKHVKNVTGRKKDDSDAIWIQKLHRCGLLQKSFQPENETRILRTYVRQRKNLISISSDSVRRMQKALELMNIKIHTVISDILGKTGMAMVGSIVEGIRSPEKLAELIDPRIKASREDIVRSLNGVWKDEYLFMLKQAFDEYNFYQSQIADCDFKIKEQLVKQIAILNEGDITGLTDEELKKKE